MWEEAFVFVHCEEVLLKYDKHPYINCEHDPIFCGFILWNLESWAKYDEKWKAWKIISYFHPTAWIKSSDLAYNFII